MIYYKKTENGVISSIGTINGSSLPEGFEEITETEYNETIAQILANVPEEEPQAEPETETVEDVIEMLMGVYND